MPNDPRARIFLPLADFERTLDTLAPDDARDAKIALVADGLSLYRDEKNWRQKCTPPYWFQCLIPLFWPLLWYRNGLSKMTLTAIAGAIEKCRIVWDDDLRDCDLSFDDLPRGKPTSDG